MSEVKSLPTRDAYGDEILALGLENPDIYVVDADIGKSCKTVEFSKQLPNQHINVGIAEQNACGVAAGLATCGKIPFVTTYAVFGSMRMSEQIRQEICYPKLNVKIACSHGGFTPANDGASHQGIEDMGILRTLPNMTVIMGCDYWSTRKLVRAAAQHNGPVYLRFTRDAIPFIYDENETFEIGKAKQLREGTDVTIIANGDIMSIALAAADQLKEEGASVRVLDMHTIKPLDTEAVLAAIRDTHAIVTVEDHNIFNGLGSAVSEIIAENGGAILRRIGIPDCFGESAPYERLQHQVGFCALILRDLHCAVGFDGVFQSGNICIRNTSKRSGIVFGNIVAATNGFQVGAVLEYRHTHTDQTAGQSDLLKAFTPSESVFLNTGHTIRQRNTLQLATIIKSSDTNTFNVFRNNNLCLLAVQQRNKFLFLLIDQHAITHFKYRMILCHLDIHGVSRKRISCHFF